MLLVEEVLQVPVLGQAVVCPRQLSPKASMEASWQQLQRLIQEQVALYAWYRAKQQPGKMRE